ncbi:UNVERIFIED_CONTAM: hypothetical protein Slati_0974400 [Sesamum latifolium]|uniref:Uncharacterized protein n=1 Tax=Sesamum latifolium TaxID=2727402 RepID=A0AAW2XQU2_9LAMI
MFLKMVIPGLSNLKRLVDVYLELWIEESQNLWYVGVLTYDNAKNEAFTMRTALMWTVNDLPAYKMAFEWSIAGVMGVLVCMDDTHAFYLQNGRKACYFDYHRQFLPQYRPYRRNKKALIMNRVERKVAHLRLMGEKIRDWFAEFSPAVEVPLALLPGYGSEHKQTKKNILWELEY